MHYTRKVKQVPSLPTWWRCSPRWPVGGSSIGRMLFHNRSSSALCPSTSDSRTRCSISRYRHSNRGNILVRSLKNMGNYMTLSSAWRYAYNIGLYTRKVLPVLPPCGRWGQLHVTSYVDRHCITVANNV